MGFFIAFSYFLTYSEIWSLLNFSLLPIINVWRIYQTTPPSFMSGQHNYGKTNRATQTWQTSLDPPNIPLWSFKQFFKPTGRKIRYVDKVTALAPSPLLIKTIWALLIIDPPPISFITLLERSRKNILTHDMWHITRDT